MKAAFRAAMLGLGQALATPRLLLLLGATNLAVAILATLPLAHSLHAMVSPRGEAMTEMPHWLATDWQAHGAPGLPFFGELAGWVILFYTAISALLSAGALWIFHDQDGAFSLAGFMRGCGRYGARFLRLLALFLGFAWILRWLVEGQLREAVRWVQFSFSSARLDFILDLALEAVLIITFYGLALVFDCARVRIVTERRRSAVLAALAGLRFCLQNTGGAAVLSLSLALPQALLLLLFGEILARFRPGSIPGLVLLFMLAQTSLLLRLAVRLAYLEGSRRWFLGIGEKQQGRPLETAL